MAILTSYDLNGKKDSFANWITNLSPVDTFFVSVTKKEQVKNTLFQWQTDALAAASTDNAQKESDNAVMVKPKPTVVHQNVTQILRKALEVTDTADAIDSWGRNKELAYQMEKAGLEIKRDLELILLQKAQAKADGTEEDPKPPAGGATGTVRKTASFGALCANSDTTDADTGAKTWIKSGTADTVTEAKLFEVTYNLYLSGSNANIIMFHPKHAAFFSSLMETSAARTKLIDNMETTLNKFVGTIIDPLGQQYKLVPNRFMPTDVIYYFNPNDWTQMVLREPSKMALAKKGSSERFMIEMEVGLRHKHPHASGVLELVS
ncbi:MAG: SU10 major capsid protein [Bacteroidales bacterium]